MKGNLRKFLSLLVAVAMLITVLPTAAFAAETVTEVSTAEALKGAITNGANIKLTADIDLTESITIPMNITVTIDLGGFTLSTEKLSTATVAIVNNGTLTISNGSIKSSSLGIDSYYYEDNTSNPMPKLNVSGVTITAPDDYNGVWNSGEAIFKNCTITGYNGISNGGELTVENSTVSGATSNGIWSRGTLIVNGGTYEGYNNGICNNNGSLKIIDGSFASLDGWDAIACWNSATLDIQGGTINGPLDSYGVLDEYDEYSAPGGPVTISGGTFKSSVLLNKVEKATVSGGTFEHSLDVKNSTVSGGTINGSFEAADNTTVTGGTFNGEIKSIGESVSISGAELNGTLTWVNNETNIPTLGEGNTYDPSFTIKAGYAIVNGEIKPLPKYTFTVASADANMGKINVTSYTVGGSTGSASTYAASWTREGVNSGTTYTLTANAKAEEGYVFKGWYYDAAGDGTALSTETSYAIEGTLTNDTTIYAVFQSTEEQQTIIKNAEQWLGTYENANEYIIDSKEDMYSFAYAVNVLGKNFTNKTVKLTTNLDYTDNARFMPVGTSTNKFAGTFDGGDHTISNLNYTGSDMVGIFGYNVGTIQNLNVDSCAMTSGADIGGIAAWSEGTITNCSVTNSTIIGSVRYVGGIVGHTFGMTMTNVASTGNTIKGDFKVGGVIGYADNLETTNVTAQNNTMGPNALDAAVIGALAGHVNAGATTLNNTQVSGKDLPLVGTNYDNSSGTIVIKGEETSIEAECIVPDNTNAEKSIEIEAGKYTVESIVSGDAEHTTDVNITGGTYTKVDETTGGEVELDVTDYIPETMTQDESGEVKEDPNKAVKLTSGETVTYYPTIAAAVAEAKDGDTVTLLRDVTVSEKIDVAKSITLDLNGQKLINNMSTDRPIHITAPVEFTVEGTKEGSGMTISAAADGKTFGFIALESGASGAKLVLNGGTYDGNTSEGSAFVRVPNMDTYTMVFNNVTAKPTRRFLYADTCGTINVTVNGGSYTATGTVTNKDEIYSVFGIDCFNGGMTFDGVTITTEGGACVEHTGGKGSFKNCNFTVNKESYPGFVASAIGASYEAEVTIEGGNYSSAGYGASVYDSGATINIKDGATITGGVKAIQADTRENGAPANVNISGGVIKGDILVNSIGGVPATLTVTDGTVNGSMATNGAATSSIAVSGGTFEKEVPKEYCAEGFAPTANTDGTFGVQIDKNEAVKVTTSTGDVAYYATLAEAVANATSGDTVTLLRDITGGGIKVPSGTDITIDFGGFTYTVTDPAVGSLNTETNGFQLLQGSNITFKNGTIKADSAATGLGIIIQNYSNLTLEDITIDGSTNAKVQYVLSCNNGTSKLTGNTNIKAAAGQTAMDVYYWPSNSYNSVSLTLDDTMTGTVTGNVSYGDDGTAGADENAKLIVKAGTINGSITEYGTVASAEKSGIAISGGTFSEPVKEKYCAAGFGPVAGTGNYTVQNVGTMQAKVVSSSGEVKYVKKLTTAVNDATEGDTVILLTDVSNSTGAMTVNAENVTLNLDGHTLKTTSIYSASALINVKKPGFSIVGTPKEGTKNGTINFYMTAKSPVIAVQAGVDVKLTDVNIIDTRKTTTATAKKLVGTIAILGADAKVVIEGSNIETKTTAIYDSTAATGSSVEINDSTIKSQTPDYAIYHNGTTGNYNLTINNSKVLAANTPVGIFVSGSANNTKNTVKIENGSEVTGQTAVEVKFTDVTVTDSTLTATQADAEYAPNGNGTCTGGYAIVVTGGTTDGTASDIKDSCVVTIESGTFTGVVGLENGVAAENPAAGAESPIKVLGGTFTPVDATVYSQEQMNEAVLGYIDPKTNNTQKNEDGSVIVIEGCVLGVTIIDGAQVRIGQGVDAEGKVDSAMGDSGLRFIATVDRTDTLAGLTDEVNGNAVVGILIYPTDKEKEITNFDEAIKNKQQNLVVIPATKFQDDADTVFSAAMTNLNVNNYNREFTAKPYVYVPADDKYYTDDQAVTRSIYYVAAGLLVNNTTEGGDKVTPLTDPDAINVLNAYLNQVGVRLTINGDITKDGTVTVRMAGETGAYTGTAFFTVDDTKGENGVYKITLRAQGNATFKEFWNDYVRINNNNSVVKKGIVDVSNDGTILTFTFNYGTAVGTTQTQTAE